MYDEWQELIGYLGDDFRGDWVPGGAQLMHGIVERKGRDYYLHQSRERLYLEVARELNGQRELFFGLVREIAPPCQMLDYACGIGSDGLRLATLGYRPDFLDDPGTCMEFLKWRLENRGSSAKALTFKDKLARYPLVVALAPKPVPLPMGKLAELGEIVAMGFGPLEPQEFAAFDDDVRQSIAQSYQLLRWASFNVVWRFAAFRTPDPHEEVENGQHGKDFRAQRKFPAH